MKSSNSRLWTWIGLAVIVLFVAYAVINRVSPTTTATAPIVAAPSAASAATPKPNSQNSQPNSAQDSYVMRNVKIYDLNGKLAYQGDMDLKPTLERIAKGVKDSHDNDGTTFSNRERGLPVKSDRNYYTEYVVRTPGMREVGPQRLIMGKDGEAYYTPDHYVTYIRVK